MPDDLHQAMTANLLSPLAISMDDSGTEPARHAFLLDTKHDLTAHMLRLTPILGDRSIV